MQSPTEIRQQITAQIVEALSGKLKGSGMNGTNLRRKSPSVRGLRDESDRIAC
jgi:hypothetical protein